MSILNYIEERRRERGGLFIILIDPDKSDGHLLFERPDIDVDMILVGSSFLSSGNVASLAKRIKETVSVPVVLFPGGASQLTDEVDAVLFMSLISGRNPRWLIEEQVAAAPIVKRLGVETIPTGYIVVESGASTAVSFVSGTMPLPAGATDLAAAHSLAAEYLGMRLVYLDAGSGAVKAVPSKMVTAVADSVSLPVLE